MFAGERCHRSHEFGDGDEGFVQRFVGGEFVGIAFTLPKTAAVSPYVPVREVVYDKIADGAARASRVIPLQVLCDLLNQAY